MFPNSRSCLPRHVPLTVEDGGERVDAFMQAPTRETVPDLIEAQVRRTPAALAVVARHGTLTYAQLDARANQLARRLVSLGVGPGEPVGVCFERSLELAIALVGVLKAGGACLPLDPAYPAARLSFIVDDAKPLVVVTSERLASRLPTGAPTVGVQGVDADEVALEPSPARTIRPDDVAYVIYTSGSTSVPKGVLLTHAGLVNHHRAVVALYGLGPGDRVLQFCSLAFDASIEELFPTWAAGGTVVFRPEDAPVLGRPWLEWLRAQAVTVLNLPTAYWHAWVRDLEDLGEELPASLRLTVVGGEKALGSVYLRWARLAGGRVRWFNAYGPTEATCMATVWEAGANELGEADPPIGRPLPNVFTRVVDPSSGVPVATGETGELLIGGVGVAPGYLNGPELTAERFLTESAGQTETRWYRTGDVVRPRADGVLDFVGRLDDQVKIQGFRVECHEVEAAVTRHPRVAEAVVVVREGTHGEKRLVAYVVPTSSLSDCLDVRELRRYLANRLPAHMVPAVFVPIAALPRTVNGKIARDALAPPGSASASARRRVPPRSTTERELVTIWAAVLGIDVDAVGVRDDFFELGGHSLLAMQVVARIREAFGTTTPVEAVVEARTVADLASVVEAEVGASTLAELPKVPRRRPRHAGARLPLSLAQEQMWGLEMTADPPGLYNITALARLSRPVDEAALREALVFMTVRHEALRTIVSTTAGRPYQVVRRTIPVELEVSDLTDVSGPEAPAVLHERVAAADAHPFSLEKPPMWRAHLFHIDAGWSQLAVTFDHLVCDGTGAYIFLDELAAAYDAIRHGRRPELPPLEVQPADFAVWQRHHVTEELLGAQVSWWASALEGASLGPAVGFDHVPAAPSRRISSRPFNIGPATRRRLGELARASGSTVFIVAAAAFSCALGRFGNTSDVLLSTTLSGRARPELDGLVGMFSGIGRIRADLSGDPTFVEVIRRVRRFVFGMYEHQDVPFMRVRKEVFADFPTGGLELARALPVELQYFRTAGARRTPGAAFVAGEGEGSHGLFFRGQLHPLSLTFLDDGRELRGTFSFKLDFYAHETIERLATGLERVLAEMGHDPWRRVAAC